MLLKEIVGKPVVGIEEGKSLATVKKLLVNRKDQVLEYILLNLHSVRDRAVTFVIPFADLEGIGDYAVMVRSREMIQRLDEEEFCTAFHEELTELIGELVISERGNRLGRITDLLIDEKQGRVLEIGVTDEATSNQFNFSAEDILVFGYDVVIVNDARAASIIPPRGVAQGFQPLKRERVPFEERPSVSFEQEYKDAQVQVSHIEEETEVTTQNETPEEAEVIAVQKEDELTSFEFKNEPEEEATLLDPEHLFESGEDISEFEIRSAEELSLENAEDVSGLVEEETYLLDEQEVLFADRSLDGQEDSLFMEDSFLELNDSKRYEEDEKEDVPMEFFKDKSEKEFVFGHSEEIKEQAFSDKTQETNKEVKPERKDNISSFDEYKKSLVKQFIDRQREVLVGKRVTEDILGKDGNILIEKGNVITMDLFNRANDDRKDSIVEMAMYSE